MDNGLRRNPWGGGGGGDPNFKTVADIIAKTLSLKETHVFSSTLVNIATLGYAGTFATLVNAPAVPMPADIAFLEGGNSGTIVIGGGIGAANFGLPNPVVFQGNSANYSPSESAGEITSTATNSRQIQFALKLLL